MAKSPTKNKVVATAADRTPKSLAQAATATEIDINRRAYDLYLAPGREDGHDVEDWLQAEHEVKGAPSALVA